VAGRAVDSYVEQGEKEIARLAGDIGFVVWMGELGCVWGGELRWRRWGRVVALGLTAGLGQPDDFKLRGKIGIMLGDVLQD